MKKTKKIKITTEIIEKTALRIVKDNPIPVINSDKELWNRYNYENSDRLDYLTKVGEFDLPMNERHMPLQRRYIDLLVAKKSIRPFQYSVYLDSEDTRVKKLDDRLRSFVEYGLQNSERIASKLSGEMQNIEGNINQIRQIMQQSAQQGIEQSPEEQSKYLELLEEMNMAKQELSRQSVLNKDFVQEFEEKQKYTSSEIIERVATKYMKYLERVLNFNFMSTKEFKNRCVTGKQNYVVAKFKDQKPTLKRCLSNNIQYQKGGTETTIQKKDWAYYNEKMSFVQILERFSEELVSRHGQDVIYKIRDTYSPMTNNSDMWALPDGGVIFGDEIDGSSNDNLNNSQNISVDWVWFREGEIIYRKTSTDKHGKEHSHILGNKEVINKDEYSYSKGKYTNKKNPKLVHDKKNVSVYSKNKGDKLEKRKFNKLYHAIIINDEYVINADEWKNIVRDEDNYNRFNLPIFGDSFDDITHKPYSLIAATNDVQDLIDLIWTSRDYMIAVAGTKGNVLDVSQKPTGMSTDEWEYHIKLGRTYIETVDANGSPKRTSFNQWSTFDNSVSQSIQYFDGMLANLEKLMGSIIGLPYQALGETTRTDQVGTNKMAIQESQMVTELMFYEHFQNDKEALEEFLSLMIADADGSDIVFTKPNIKSTSQYVLSTKKLLNENIKINLYSLFDDKEKIQQLKGIATTMVEKLGLSFGNLIKVWNSKTSEEMEHKVQYFEAQAQKVNQEMQAAAGQQAKADKKEMDKYANDLAIELEKMKAQFAQGNLQIEQARLEFDREKMQMEQQAKGLELKIKSHKNSIDMMKVREDTAVEKAMLISDDKHRTFDDKLRALELEINLMLESKRIKLEEKEAKMINTSRPNRTSNSSNEKINDK